MTSKHFPGRCGDRRGVLLLIILGLLAMFGLVAVAFVVLTGHEQRNAVIVQRIDEQLSSPEEELNQAASQILVGSTNPSSVIGPHSLLEDIYGAPQTPTSSTIGLLGVDDDLDGTVDEADGTDSGLIGRQGVNEDGDATTDETDGSESSRIPDVPAAIAGGQLIAFTLPPGYDPMRSVGSVLTMLSGSAMGQSTRIVGYDRTSGRVEVERFSTGSPARYDRILINGTAFSGTGFGFAFDANPATTADYMPMLWAREPVTGTGQPYALLPNPTAFQPNAAIGYIDPAGPGGANEDYDAPDFQNMLLGAQFALANGEVATIPSLHRPELVRYWMQQVGAPDWTNLATNHRDLARKILLRPLQEDNPNFTGSNPGFNPIWDGRPWADYNNDTQNDYDVAPQDGICDYQWDVDNDGDGQTDSIWVDVGLPVRSMADGRQYKPLVAILCVDLDGRLNLNAHGSLAQTDPAYSAPINVGGYNMLFAGGNPSAALPRGQGYGPAEINLGLGMQLTLVDYRQLLIGAGTVPGRYGASQVPGIAGNDPLGFNRWYEYGGDYWALTAAGTGAYGTPPNLKGRGAIGLDPAGRPIYGKFARNEAWAVDDDGLDDPYELNLTKPTAADQPFTVAELERILRPYDTDAARLPGRLAALAPSLLPTANPQRRLEVTTESWDLSTPNVALPRYLADQIRADLVNVTPPLPSQTTILWLRSLLVPRHLVDLLAAKLYYDHRTGAGAQAPDAVYTSVAGLLPTVAPLLLPPEMLAGLKMDLNRPFGNGADDPTTLPLGAGVVDEPASIIRPVAGSGFTVDTTQPGEFGEQITPYVSPTVTAAVGFNPLGVGAGAAGANNPKDVNGDGQINEADAAMARQLYARHLYVLAMMMSDLTALDNVTGNRDATARLLAQWAVNVVDFRDRDAIMTPFEYDTEPFTDNDGDGNPWDVDGFIENNPPPPTSDDGKTYRGLVWGCEKPELLITETLAFHDRRTEDLDSGDGFKNTPTDPAKPDADFDQQCRPEGSLFLEIYNPSNTMEPRPGELYNAPNGGVLLSKTVGTSSVSPVWRMIIQTASQALSADPDDNTIAPERSVYFVNAQSINVTNDGRRHYPTRPASTPIAPGRYAVVGPGNGTAPLTTSTSYVGFLSAQRQPTPATRQIVLSSSSTPQVQVRHNQSATLSDQQLPSPPTGGEIPTDGRIQPPTAVIVDKAIVTGVPKSMRLSVSEPLDGYPAVDRMGIAINPTTLQYVTAFQSPLDKTANSGFYDILVKNGTHPNLFVVHLQRLANPLLPWNARSNPYRTIDTMPIDVTTFNGVRDTPAHEGIELGEEDTKFTTFASCERGTNSPPAASNNLWTREPLLPAPDSNRRASVPLQPFPESGTHEYAKPLYHSLGFLNWHLNAGFGPQGPRDGTVPLYMGDPQGEPFPWLTWNNRPFISEMELLLVPATNMRQLLSHPDLNELPFLGKQRFGVAGPADPYNDLSAPFPHLLNFFYSTQTDRTTGPTSAPELHRLLEFVHVPSRFAGTELQGNPDVFANTAPVDGFRPPFNWISTYREPGRINLNTIYSQNVWNGLMNNFPLGAWQSWGVFLGYRCADFTRNTIDLSLLISPDAPTRFARPFRSHLSNGLAPPTANTHKMVAEHDVCGTIMRGVAGGGGERPLFGYESANPYDNTNRNPYFRYAGLQRLANLVTTRSNVYAVWITVGYFEVTPWNAGIDAQHRDGYQLGPELGIDTGEVKRHRAFYIFDRSIPVGFQRGEDLNSGKAVLLQRFIE